MMDILFTNFSTNLPNATLIAFFTAYLSGILVSLTPCIQNIIEGMSRLFIFSPGIGAIFIFLVTFERLIKHIPRAGSWLV